MRLEKLSASSLKVSETCLARFKAERDAARGSRQEFDYNRLGSACHDALENYVRQAIMDETAKPEFATLKLLFMSAFHKIFGKLDQTSAVFKDGLDLLEKWYERTAFGGFEIISLEKRECFDLDTSAGRIPFNFVMDRLDKLDDGVYRVLDYKTSRTYMSPEDLFTDIQSQIYALAVRIMHPDAVEIIVEFDMLRHSPVAASYRREDNVLTWKRLKAAAEHIIQSSEEAPPETLNDQCLFCIRKATCGAIQSNIDAGGIYNLGDIQEVVNKRAIIASQEKAAAALRKDLDQMILDYMKQNDIFSIDTPLAEASAKIFPRRSVDAKKVEQVIGAELADEYLGRSLTMKKFDELIASSRISPDARGKLEALVERIPSEPRVETKFKTRFS